MHNIFKYEVCAEEHTGCPKIREFPIQSVVGNLPPQRYIGLKVDSLNSVFFKYRLSVFIVIYGVDDCGK
jgi:hypothetical protein